MTKHEPLHFEIMALLKEAGTLHVAEIGERLQIARAQMTHLIDKLVALGIVERQMATADRRMTNIVLTGKGRAFFEEHDSNIKNAVKETLSYLTDEELEDLSDSLRKLRDILAKRGELLLSPERLNGVKSGDVISRIKSEE